VSSYTYDTAGRLTAASIPNHTITYGFGASGPAGGPDPCTSVTGAASGAGKNGNRTRMVDTLTGTSPAKTVDYCYDCEHDLGAAWLASDPCLRLAVVSWR
jgi:hypothetical protein